MFIQWHVHAHDVHVQNVILVLDAIADSRLDVMIYTRSEYLLDIFKTV